MILEHRLMHAETLIYLIHNLPYSRRLTACEGLSPMAHLHRNSSSASLPGRHTRDGRESAFGWDNEFDLNKQQVNEFTISKYKVTNAQYLAFVNDGGSVRSIGSGEMEMALPRLSRRGALAIGSSGVCQLRASSGIRRLDKKVPPTEAQFHRAAFGSPEELNESSVGKRLSTFRTRQFRLPVLRPGPGHFESGRGQRVWSLATGRQWLGVDFHRIRAISWV
jgi:hypothetical protein